MILLFCKDGHLRLKYDFNEVKEFPLLNVESFYKMLNGQLSLLSFWKQYWFLPLEFEEGLTFKEFFLNLEPWAEFFQEIIPQAVNLKEFIQEVKKPALLTPSELHKLEPICDMIVINQVTSLSPVIFRKNKAKSSIIPITETNGKFSCDYQIQISGAFGDLRSETYNIENNPLHILGNRPIFLNRNHYIIVDKFDNNVSKSNNIPQSIFNSDAYGTYQLNELQDLIISEKQLNLMDILHNFFKFFFTSPEERNISMENIDNFLREIPIQEACDLFQSEDSVIQDRLIAESVVIEEESIFDDIDEMRNQIYQTNISIPQIKTRLELDVKFQKNAFSYLDYNAHKAKALIDAHKFNDKSGEINVKESS